jgi:hypothetical protein
MRYFRVPIIARIQLRVPALSASSAPPTAARNEKDAMPLCASAVGASAGNADADADDVGCSSSENEPSAARDSSCSATCQVFMRKYA